MQNSIRVSIVVCCHNSRTRLPQTLQALASQQGMSGNGWEVLVVDNASTDGTGDFAVNLWRELGMPCAMRVVAEPRLGLINARFAGIAAAAYEVLSFVDDDNWVSPNWCATICRLMAEHPELGVIGSNNSAAFDAGQDVPSWFPRLAHGYAVGRQAEKSGFLTDSMPRVFGAGLTVRAAALRELISLGFTPILAGRSGTRLSAGDDTELCYAVGMRGWRMWYEDALRLSHYMPSNRLTDDYASRLFDGLGYSMAVEKLYQEAFPGESLRKRLLNFGPVCRLIGLRWFCYYSLRAFLSPKDSDTHRLAKIEAKFFRGFLTGLSERRRFGAAVTSQVTRLTATVPVPLPTEHSFRIRRARI